MTEAGAAEAIREPFDALAQAKELLRSVRAGALATLVPGQAFPFVSLVNVATAPDASPILLLSKLAAHTRHLAADPRLSLLLAQTGAGDPLAHPRITLMGRAARIDDPGRRAALKERFLAKHPKSALYADFTDFSFWLVAMEQAHLNGGFARAGHFEAKSLVTSLDGAEALVAGEVQGLAQLNASHQSALAQLAAALVGKLDGDWRATGIDPEGLDLACGDRTARVVFPRRVQTLEEVLEILPQLVDAARQKPNSPELDA
jgi:putative heme iron utilization protein